MPLSPQDRAAIQATFDTDLHARVKIDFFQRRASALLVPGREPCLSCPAIKELLEELVPLSPQITLHTYDLDEEPALADRRDVDSVPTIVIRGEINRPLRFCGAPAGFFFALLVRALIDAAAKPRPPLAEITRHLNRLRSPVRLRVFGASGDEHSAQAAMLAFQFALTSSRIAATVYDIDEFAALAQRLRIGAVPATIIDDRLGFAGVATGIDFARFLHECQAHPATAALHLPETKPATAHPWQPPESPAPGAGSEQRTPGGIILPGR